MTNFQKLLPAARRGEENATEEIINAFRPLIINLCQREHFTSIRDDVEELCYLCILEAIHNDRIDNDASFPGYIRRCMIYKLKNYCRKTSTVSKYETATTDKVLEFMVDDDFSDAKLTGLALEQHLEELPTQQRSIIQLVYYQGLTLAAAARQLGIRRQTAARLQQKALDRLRELLTV